MVPRTTWLFLLLLTCVVSSSPTVFDQANDVTQTQQDNDKGVAAAHSDCGSQQTGVCARDSEQLLPANTEGSSTDTPAEEGKTTDGGATPSSKLDLTDADTVRLQHMLVDAEVKDDSSDESWDSPIQLVRPNANGHEQLEVVEEGLKRLSRVPSPLALIAVVGKFHTGKSFLLNQVMGKQSGFGVGSTVRPETMGIWMWGKPVTMTLDSGKNISVVFIDTEGFAASNISESYDAKVFAVASLLSSYLIYNSVKIIDQSDIDYLELLSRRTQLFALQSQLSADKYALEFNHNLLRFPSLLWVVQDFVQAGLSGNEGQSAQEWLKQLMRTSTREQEHEISLLDIFENVDCHTLFLPAIKKALLEDLSLAREEDLTEEYREERDDLIEKLRRGLVAKERNGIAVDGAELALLIKLLVTAANEGSLAEIPGRWGAFTQHLMQTAYVECLKFFDSESDRLLHADREQEGTGSALGKAALEAWYTETSGKTLKLMERLLVGLGSTSKQSTAKVEKALGRRYITIKELNTRRVDILCQQTQQSIEVDVEFAAGKLTLPQSSSDLHSQLSSLINLHSQNFPKDLAHLNDTDLFKTYNASLQKVLSGCIDKFLQKNRLAVEVLLGKAQQEALSIFHEGVKLELGRPLPLSQLRALQSDEADKAQEHYAAATAIAHPEHYYELHKSSFVLALKVAMEEGQIANNERVRVLCSSKVTDVMKTLQDRFNSKKIQLPANETEILSQFKATEELIHTQFVDSLEQFVDMEAVRTSFDSLKARSHEILDGLLKENLDAYTREVEVPLATAVKIIMMSADKYDTTFSLRQYINSLCLLHLDSGKAQSWDNRLKLQIVDNFVSSHPILQEEFRRRASWLTSLKGFLQWLVWCFGGF